MHMLYEDSAVTVVNKPAGIPTSEIEKGALLAAHRLDKDTSGVLIYAKNPEALEYLRRQFKDRQAHKEYLALVYGVPKEKEGIIEQALKRSPRYPMRRTVHPGGKLAITEWRVEEVFDNQLALLRLFPRTGRTHQLRAHLHWLGHPVVGDMLYNFRSQKDVWSAFAQRFGETRQMLHAEKLRLTLPSGEVRTFVAELPQDMRTIIDQLRQ